VIALEKLIDGPTEFGSGTRSEVTRSNIAVTVEFVEAVHARFQPSCAVWARVVVSGFCPLISWKASTFYVVKACRIVTVSRAEAD